MAVGGIIIEHPTRGTLRPDSEPGIGEWHWSWSGSRNDPDTAWQFPTVEAARAVFAQLPDRVRAQADIKRYNPNPTNQLTDPYEVVS